MTMLNFIVDLYRSMIGFVFVLGAILAAASVAYQPGIYGVLIAAVIIGGTVALTGVSAVLLSINGHLAALRRERP